MKNDYICSVLSKETQDILDKTKRYAQLAKGNVRNFQERTARTVSLYSVGWLLLLSSGNSHDLLLKKWYISATLHNNLKALVAAGGRRN